MAALRRALPASFKPSTAVLTASVERLVRAGVLFRLKRSVSAQDPGVLVARAIEDALEQARTRGEALVSARDLKAAVKLRAAGLEALVPEVLETLALEGRVHPHHWTSKGTRAKKALGYALDPEPAPEAALFVAKSRTGVAKVVTAAAAAGAAPSAIAEAFRRLVISDAELVLHHLRTLVAKGQPGELQSLGSLRLVVPLDKASFDRAALCLRAERRVSLHQHDEPQALSRLERACLVVDDDGTHYVGITLRKGG
jgi:hypothetical protein